MNSTQLREQAKAHLDRANALLAKIAKPEDLTPELQKQITDAQSEFDRTNALAVTTAAMETKGADYVAANGGAGAAVMAGWRPSAPNEGDFDYDGKAWREATVDTRYGKKAIRFNVPLAVQQKGYSGAFEGYLRKGVNDLGPNDRKTLSEGTDTAGGFLVPEDYQAELIKKVATNAAIRPLARSVSTGRDTVKWPKVDYTTDDKYTSGVRMSWVGELPASSSAHRVTDPVFSLLSIPVHTAMASMPLSLDLVEDAAFDVTGVSSAMIGEAFALGEDDAFLNGSGIMKPRGILDGVDATGRIVSVVSGTSAAISTSGDAHSGKRLLDLYYGVPSQYRSRGTWLMNSATLKEVENLVDAQKRPLLREMATGSLADGEPGIIKGKPIVVDEFAPDIGASTYPIVFGDFQGYMVVDRVGFSVQRMVDSAYAELNLMLLLARKRVGGDLIQPFRMKALKAST